MQGQVLRRGAAWIFTGKASDQVLTFLFGIVLARLLAPEVFGMLLTLQVFTGLAGFAAGGGMGQALVRARKVSQQDYDIVFTLQLLIGIAIYTAFFLSAPLFARWYEQPLYTDLLRLLALNFLYRPFVNVSGSILFRQMRFKARAAANIGALVASSGVSIALAWNGFGVWSLVWGGIVGAATQIAIQMHLTRWRPGLSTAFARGGDLARYGALVSLNNIVNYVHTRVCIVQLSHGLGPASVGLYNKGESLANMPHAFVTNSVYGVLFRALAAERDNLDRCRYLYFRSIALVSVYATPFYVGLLWLAEPLVRGIYGQRWAEAAAPLAILALSWPFMLVGNLSGAVSSAFDRLKQELWVQLASLAVAVVAVALAMRWGISGVAWAIVATTVFRTALIHRLALRALRARWRATLRALVPAVWLNVPLALALVGMDAVLARFALPHDLLHVGAMALAGGVVYASLALLVPIAAIASEQERWRRLVRSAVNRLRP